jgi:SNF2 family DNA or RNA helicase
VALSPEAWPSRERWVNRYCETVTGDYREEILGLRPATEPEFRLTLLGQHRRVAKADVLHQLPPKVYSVRTVELPRQWRKVYDDFAEQMLAELPNGTTFSVMDIMSQFGHLSRLASAAADVEIAHGPDVDETTGELKRHVRLHLKAPSWKVDALLEVLAERQNGTREPVVVFAPSRQLIMLAGAAAAAAGLKVGYIVGGQSMTERTVAVESFQSGALDLICATTGAGGVGITLTAARTVVFLQRPWSLVEAIQAEDRCHRIGSERHDSIEIVDVVARNTLDTRIRAVLRERAGQLAALVQDPRIVADLLGGTRTTAARDTSPVPSSISTADGPTDRT